MPRIVLFKSNMLSVQSSQWEQLADVNAAYHIQFYTKISEQSIDYVCQTLPGKISLSILSITEG